MHTFTDMDHSAVVDCAFASVLRQNVHPNADPNEFLRSDALKRADIFTVSDNIASTMHTFMLT